MLLPFVAEIKATVFVGCNITSGRLYSTIFCFKDRWDCYIHWQMLLSMCGKFNLCQCRLLLLPCVFSFGDCDLRLMFLPLTAMADVIACHYYGWCYSHVADVKPLGWFYFSLSSGMLFRTSSHMSMAYFPLIKLREKLFPKQHQKIMNINIFCSPQEAMLDNWQKLDFSTKYFLF